MDLDRLYTTRAILEIAPGPHPRRIPTSTTIDLIPGPDVDIVSDIFDYLSTLPDSSVYLIQSSHFLEHIASLDLLFNEFSRVLMPSGMMQHTVPHFSNPYYYSDPTHIRMFGLYTMCYMCQSSLFIRSVPSYSRISLLRLSKVRITFKPPRFLAIFALLGLPFQLIVNRFSLLQEIYEYCGCWIFPCSEITYSIESLK